MAIDYSLFTTSNEYKNIFMEFSRRDFIKTAVASTFVGILPSKARASLHKNNVNINKNMTLSLPKLPYEMDALAPYISKETLEYHYGKHHQAYVTNGNKLIAGTKFEGQDIVSIIKETAGKAEHAGIFNNAAQVWNHSFYWQSMSPNGGGKPVGSLAKKIEEDFGSYENFKTEFATAGATQFGSGWAWLVLENGKLKVTKTPNADCPFTQGQIPLLTMDVWEHAYYIDFRNARPSYIDTFLEKLINWEFANSQFESAI